MSTRPIGAGEFRNIQAEIEALSAKVNSGDREVGKKLETLQQWLDDVLFNGTGVEIDDMTQCQLKLDRVKSAFQRGVAAPSSTTSIGSPSTPKMVASSELPSFSQATSSKGQPEKNFSVTLVPPSSSSVSQSLHQQSSMPSYSHRAPTNTTTTMTTRPEIATSLLVKSEGNLAVKYVKDWLKVPKIPLMDGGETLFEVENAAVVENNQNLLKKFWSKNDLDVFYLTWLGFYTERTFRRVWQTGAVPLKTEAVEHFEIHWNRLKAAKVLGAFDFRKDFRGKYEAVLDQHQRGVLDGRDLLANGAFSNLLSFYIVQYDEELKSELEQSYPEPVNTKSSEQVIKANQAFLSLLWMKNPLAYYWTWFEWPTDDGEAFIAATRSGTKLLSETDKEAFKKYFQTIFEDFSVGKFDFRSEFKPYVDEFTTSPRCSLSQDPVFWELLKIYDLAHYDRAIKSKNGTFVSFF